MPLLPRPELRLEADDLVQQSAFGALERWAREAPSPGDSPPRPSRSAPPGRVAGEVSAAGWPQSQRGCSA